MSENEIRIRFELENGYGSHYVQESKFEVFSDLNETDIDCIGEQLNVFLKQAGYVREHDYILMEDVTEDEREALYDYLQTLREGKDEESAS